MTDIVEKVALAIHDEFHADPDPRREAKTGFYYPGSLFGGMARVAIKATLEANVNVPELSSHIQELLSTAETMKEDMGAVNWGDIGVVDIEYRLSLMYPKDGARCVVLVEEASPDSKLVYWLNKHLDKDRFPNTSIECEW